MLSLCLVNGVVGVGVRFCFWVVFFRCSGVRMESWFRSLIRKSDGGWIFRLWSVLRWVGMRWYWSVLMFAKVVKVVVALDVVVVVLVLGFIVVVFVVVVSIFRLCCWGVSGKLSLRIGIWC